MLAVEAAISAYGNRARGWKQAARVVALGLALGLGMPPARGALEHRRARQLGLTIETAPQARANFVGAIAPVLVWKLVLRLRGMKAAEPSWPRELAQSVIRETYRRREWRRALGRSVR